MNFFSSEIQFQSQFCQPLRCFQRGNGLQMMEFPQVFFKLFELLRQNYFKNYLNFRAQKNVKRIVIKRVEFCDMGSNPTTVPFKNNYIPII